MRSSCSRQEKVIRLVKTDEKIMEFREPSLVSELLGNHSGFVASLTKEASEHLPPNYELKVGETCHLLPDSSVSNSSNTKRIKVVLTKKQLHELLTEKASLEEILSELERRRTCCFDDSSSNWKPNLESIPEGTER